eukprot:TRINITY_DN19890_c0_g1_i1.p1 TRINITY_DN19890_c0_g1~~TRINITY_DN19890_c0_g1_i1.p1  ORF type:complete len:224 (-),score=47.83 TRINITY_DN19890_c0_g1_i1:195-866(-)
MPVVSLNIGGVLFSVAEESLARDPNSMLAAMFAATNQCQPAAKDEHGAFIVVRSPEMFYYVFRYLRQEALELQELTEVGLKKLLVECDFYQLLGLKRAVQGESICRRQAEQQHARRISILEQEKRTIEQENLRLHDALQQEQRKNRGIYRERGCLVKIGEAAVGERVRLNPEEHRGYGDSGREGTIISVTEDNGTEIAVRWDDGSESHNFHCGKKGNHELVYA